MNSEAPVPLSGRPLAQHHNAYGSLVPWLSFDMVIRSCRSRSSNLFYCYLVSLRSVCHCETKQKPICTYEHTRGAYSHTCCLVSSWNTDLCLLCVLLPDAVTSVTVNEIKCSREEQNPVWYDLFWCECCVLASSYLCSNIVEEGTRACVRNPAVWRSRVHCVLISHRGLDLVLLASVCQLWFGEPADQRPAEWSIVRLT